MTWLIFGLLERSLLTIYLSRAISCFETTPALPSWTYVRSCYANLPSAWISVDLESDLFSSKSVTRSKLIADENLFLGCFYLIAWSKPATMSFIVLSTCLILNESSVSLRCETLCLWRAWITLEISLSIVRALSMSIPVPRSRIYRKLISSKSSNMTVILSLSSITSISLTTLFIF